MISPIVPTGTNTASSDNVAANTANAISFVPLPAASIGVAPSSIWRTMFSTTTMASSIRMPTAKLSASSDILFSVNPCTFIRKNVATIEVGIEMPATTVARQSRMNRNVINTANKLPKIREVLTSSTLSRI